HDVVHGVRKRLGALLRQAIADREQRIAVRRKIRSPKLKLSAHALLPAAAMHSNQRRERPSAFRQVEIALQRNAVMGGVGQGGTKFMLGRAGHWSSSPRFGKFVFVWWDADSLANISPALHCNFVMAGLVPAIHVLRADHAPKDVDARHKAGHD